MGLLVYGNKKSDTKRQIKIFNLTTGHSEITFPIGAECTGGCQAEFILSTSNLDAAIGEVSVPTSKLFSVGTPVTQVSDFSLAIEREQKKIDVQIELQEAVTKPGQETEFTVRLRDPESKSPISGEIAVFVVDKAVLDLKPMPLSTFDEALAQAIQSFPQSISAYFTKFIAKNSYERVRDIIFRRLTANPFVEISSWPMLPSAWMSDDFDIEDAEYFERFRVVLTDFFQDFGIRFVWIFLFVFFTV